MKKMGFQPYTCVCNRKKLKITVCNPDSNDGMYNVILGLDGKRWILFGMFELIKIEKFWLCTEHIYLYRFENDT